MTLPFGSRYIFRTLSPHRPLEPIQHVIGDDDGDDNLIGFLQELPWRACPQTEDFILKVSLLEYDFESTDDDEISFVTLQGRLQYGGSVETKTLNGRNKVVLRGTICLNRALFENWDQDPNSPHWFTLQNRTRCIAHELLYLRQYFEELRKYTSPPKLWSDFCEWRDSLYNILTERVVEPQKEDDDDLLCSVGSIHRMLMRCYELYGIKERAKKVETYADFLSQENTEMISKFREHWRQTWCVSDEVIEKRISEALEHTPEVAGLS